MAFPADLVQAVAGEAVADARLLSDPVDARERLVLLHQLRRDQRLQAVQAVVQRAAKLAEKGDLGVDQLTPSGVVASDLFESASEASSIAIAERAVSACSISQLQPTCGRVAGCCESAGGLF